MANSLAAPMVDALVAVTVGNMVAN